ncbi:MAG TPA: monooxygenase, partial [Myxococcota bacterium]|nr:monooxygenase [Myxococcota bacterium]
AGDALACHAMAACLGVRDALAGARLAAPWIAAGPIRPGLRRLVRARTFVVGNAAAEAHPLVAEGISMAIQSSWLLAAELGAGGALTDAALAGAGRRYARAWRRHFRARVLASSAFAALTAGPAAAASIALLRAAPSLLTLGAGWSGKARTLQAAGPAW